MTSVKIGNVELISFHDLSFSFPYSAAFPSVPADRWAPYKDLYPECWTADGQGWATHSQAFLIRSGGQNVLVDTGFGPGPHAMIGGTTGNLTNDMRSKGVSPDDVNIVILTHLHTDHTGWAAIDGKPGFPNARYLFPEQDWTTFTAQPDGLVPLDALRPLVDAGKVDLVSGERIVTPEVTIIPTPGHTPGHQSVIIASAGQRGIILGDVFNHPAQAQETDWNAGFDRDPALAIETRKRVLDRVESDGSVAASGHYRPPGFGRLVRADGKRVFRAL